MLCNLATAPRSNDLSSPPVPAVFAVEQPTQRELQLRETISIARGVRTIKSAWPGQSPRQAYSPMSGRSGYNARRGGDYHANNRATSYLGSSGRVDGPPNKSGSSPGPGGQTSTTRAVTAGGVPPRTPMPVLLSLPTMAERIATQQARDQENRNAILEKKRNKQLIKNNSRLEAGSASASYIEQTRRIEPTESLNLVRGMAETSGNPFAPPRGPQQQQSIFVNKDWAGMPEISVRVGPDLPLQYTTWDMYFLFKDYGEIEAIELFENSSGTRDGFGRVRFSRVFEPFWNGQYIKYLWHNESRNLRVKIEDTRRKFQIASPVNKNKMYSEKFVTFKLKEMSFGFMIEPNSMVAMYTTGKTDDVTFEVNLYFKQVDVMFNINLARGEATFGSTANSKGKGKQAEQQDPELERENRRESYRFRIPFAHLGAILEQGPIISGADRTILISLPSPPMFWRKLHNVANSHDHRAKYWTIQDMWFRQTGIALDPLLRSRLPISLKQALPIIDTGRWTTYSFNFALGSHQINPFEEMISALRDFNVNTETRDEIRVTRDQPTPIWDSIDTESASGGASSFSGELSEATTSLLPYPTRYQLEVCISQNCLNEYNLTTEFINRLAHLSPDRAVSLLEVTTEKNLRIYNPMDIFDYSVNARGTGILNKINSGDYQLVRKANVTPSTVYYTTPTLERTNRVMRNYSEHSDRFLRVQFVDEKLQGRINSTDKKTMNEVFSRIMTALDNGIQIGNRHFEFLAFGNSQIREHGAYFFASTDHTSAADIRAWMGEFRDIKIVAKHAARLGQCFSTTQAIRGVRVDVQEIEDINHNGYCFSDGVGKISDFLARIVAMELELPPGHYPSCIQFRLGGCKGVLTVWPDAKGREVSIRPSQRKFQADHNILEVIRTSKFVTAALNRQLIIVLSSLGTQDNVFTLKLTQMLADFQDAMHDPAVALSLLCRTIDANQFTLSLAAMVRDRFMEFHDPFIISLLRLWRAWSIKYLKEKARITIEKGAFVLGVVDETGILKGYYENGDDAEKHKKEKVSPIQLPEIFLKIDDPENLGEFKVIEGLCIIARNPSLHPGDIRTVRAVNVPELGHLRNVVVFPSKGDRDLASMLSGGDLDGDDYIVIWDPDLTFGVINHQPMDFSPLEPRVLDRDVTVSDIRKFFVNYMKNDNLGTIANAHLAWADSHEDGVKSDQCFRLAALHSDAVDYVKTGEPAEMPADLRPRKYPHFMEKSPEKTRQSHKILGKLYDQVVKIDFVPSYELQFDDRILNAYVLSDGLLAAARAVKAEYDAAMNRILAQHDIRTEFEVYSTFVMHHSNTTKDYKFHEEIGSIRDSLKDTFRKMVIGRVGQRDEAKLGPFIAAMYTVTKQELDAALEVLQSKKAKGKVRTRTIKGNPLEFTPDDISGMPLISFPWLFPEILGRLANREYPFTNIDSTLDGSLMQYEYDHVALPDTKRGAARGVGSNGTQNEGHGDEIYEFERGNNTVADDPAGLEIEQTEEYPGDNSEAYINFDYKGQEQQNSNCRMGVNDNENHSHHACDSDGDNEVNTTPNHKEDCHEIGVGRSGMGTSKGEDYYTPKGENSYDGDGGETSGSGGITDDKAEGLSFCDQFFQNIHPGNDIF